MWYSNYICGWPTASIKKATVVAPYLGWLSLPSLVCPHKCLKLDNRFLTHTFQLNTPNHSTTCIRERMTGALNNPLTLTSSMSSQTRQHPPLSSSNRHFISLRFVRLILSYCHLMKAFEIRKQRLSVELIWTRLLEFAIIFWNAKGYWILKNDRWKKAGLT